MDKLLQYTMIMGFVTAVSAALITTLHMGAVHTLGRLGAPFWVCALVAWLVLSVGWGIVLKVFVEWYERQ